MFAVTTVNRGISITAMQINFLVKSAVMLCRDADGGAAWRCAGSNIPGPGGPVVRLLGAGIYLFRQNTHIIPPLLDRRRLSGDIMLPPLHSALIACPSRCNKPTADCNK